MIKFVVKVATLEHLEILIGVARTLDLETDLGVEAPPLPSKRRKGRSIKRAKKTKGKRRSGRMMVKAVPINSATLPPRVFKAHQAVFGEFGGRAFQKSLANAVIAKALKTKSRPTGMISMMLDRGGLVPA